MNTEQSNATGGKTLIERLFAAGSHFGFTKSRRHPTVEPYLFGNKQGTDIFDLEKTAELLATAKEVVKEAAKATHKRLRQVEFRTQAPDHPILWAADESYYLKFFIFQVVE